MSGAEDVQELIRRVREGQEAARRLEEMQKRQAASQRPIAQPQPANGALRQPANAQFSAGGNARSGATQVVVTNGQGNFRQYGPAPPYAPHPNQQGRPSHVNTLADRIVTDSIRMGVASVSGQAPQGYQQPAPTAGPSRPVQFPNQLTRVPAPQPNGVQVYGPNPNAPVPVYRNRQDSPAQPQNRGPAGVAKSPYAFQPRRPFTGFDLADMRSRISRWEAGLTQDAWFDFYKAFGWGEGWIVTRKGGLVYVSDALGKSLPIAQLYQVLGTMLDPDPNAPTMATMGPAFPAAAVPQTASTASTPPVAPSRASVAGIPSTVIQPVNPAPSTTPVFARVPRPKPPPPAPPPSTNTLPRSPAQANKKRLARDVLNALGKRARTIGDGPFAPAAKRVTIERNASDDAQSSPAVAPPPVLQPANATPAPSLQPQMGQFQVSLTPASTTPALEAPAPTTSVIQILEPPRVVAATAPPAPFAPSAPVQEVANLQPAPATDMEPPQSAPAAAPQAAYAEPSSAPAVHAEPSPAPAVYAEPSPAPAAHAEPVPPPAAGPSSEDIPDHTSQTTTIEPPPVAVAATAVAFSPKSHRTARKTTGGMNRQPSPSNSPSEASSSRLAPSSPQQKQHTSPRPSSVPPPPTSPSDIEEPLFLPSSAPASQAGSPAPIIDLTASPERPRYKPKRQVYVLVPPPPPYVRPFIQSVRHQQRKDRSGKGKARAAKDQVQPRLSPAPVEEDEYDYSYDSLGNRIDDEMERSLMNVACTRLQLLQCKWERCEVVMNSNINLFDHLRRHHRPQKFSPGESYFCRWTQCGKHVKYGDRHLMKHAFDCLVCPYKNSDSEDCDEVFRTAGPLIRHAAGHTQDEDELRPSCRPRVPEPLAPPPQLPATRLGYFDITPASISKEEHEELHPWILDGVAGVNKPSHDRTQREIIRAHPGNGEEEEGSPRYRYEYLTDYSRRYGSNLSEPTGNLRLASLHTEEVRKSIERGLVLFGDAGHSSDEEFDQLAEDSDGDDVRYSTPDPSTLSREPSVDDWPPTPTPGARLARGDRTLRGTASPQRQRVVRAASPIAPAHAGDSDEEAIELMLTEAP
ncbi:hypothetical protein BKA70DRAFT_1257088 [Coprinopsis sp. MPI-PUGE-AT-0042]|nr:hypothetical protein BKA70DRAFT_1257088 [Coprinopsis sp. MPI-PUGE-AT-0042]